MKPVDRRLAPRVGERSDRGRAVSFSFDGWKVTGFGGDTLGSAAAASGAEIFSRSFKYHRPRGLYCCSGHCPNCMMTVDGVPNVRVCAEPAREGIRVQAQNVLGESRGCSRAAAPVCGFSRGTTAKSVSLSWGAREVGSPCEWRGGARHCSRAMVGESGLETC